MSLIENIAGFVNLQTVLVLLVVLLMTYVYVTRPRNLPPGPWGWPIVGNLYTLSKGNIHLTLSKWRKKYGAIVFFKIGTLGTVCLNDYDVIKEAYVRRSDMFGNRPTNLRIVNQLINQKGIIFAPLGPHWWEQRQFAVASLGFGSLRINERILEEAATMQAELLKTKGKPFNIRRMLQQASTNVVCYMVFGKRWDYTNQTFQNIMQSLDVVFRTSVFFLPENVFPYVPGFLKRGDKVNVEKVLQLVRDEVKEHKETFNRDNIRDFIDSFLLEMQNQTDLDGSTFTERQLEMTVFDLFNAGTETVSTTMWWACLLMILNPDVQNKVQEEIGQVLGRDSRPSMAYRSQMPYTTATVAEIQRYGAVSPIGLPHAVPRDTEFYGYIIPKDTIVFAGQWSVHHDPELFPEPDMFDPERFLDDEGNFKNIEYFMPFSMGPRSCMGQPLAEVQLFLLFTNLMQNFKLKLPEGAAKPSSEGVMGITLAPKPFDLVAIPRD
uniref:Uncharacterized protein n=1 Tax=Branchiostoma floridae TaxID=7739 RepID=C3YY86_BRAFL|eukprot:XP_002598693.1 hypothetical protein BRAFLDRAFT_250482 [Branchiostoma floridae]